VGVAVGECERDLAKIVGCFHSFGIIKKSSKVFDKFLEKFRP
jgi:hypothetical protein